MVRRLTAILAADIVGFSALMAQDEAGTLKRLIAFRRKQFDPHVAAHRGRVVKLMGDGALVEFPSVVDAVSCAIAIQTQIAASVDQTIQLRIGVNLGDVLATGDDIYGDGVNIAARLEPLAAPGGVCISGVVQQSIGNRVEARFSDGGDVRLKNMVAPLRVYHWHPEQTGAPDGNASEQKGNGKASIAVLAFDNMSADPEQEYFSDGIAEDIITALSHFRDFFVIARNSSFTYKGQAIRVEKVCADLGVRYLLEGSVRKAGTKVRVTAQLIDGETGAHIWATRLDRELDDIFLVQDEITQAIVAAVAPETVGAETRRARSKRPDTLTTWDQVLRARWHLGKFNRADNQTASVLLSQAIVTDAELGDAHAANAQCNLMAMLHGWHGNVPEAINAARLSALRAVELDDQNANAHGILGMALTFAREFDDAEHHLTRAIGLNPNLAIGHGNFGVMQGVIGDFDKAVIFCDHAIALSPRDPLKAFWRGGVGIGAFVAEHYQACVDNARKGLKESPGYASLLRQEAAALGMMGRHDEATAAVENLLVSMPDLTISQVRNMVPVRNPIDWDRWLDGLRRAGLPE